MRTNDFWRRAEELFHAALERTPQSREIFLREACGEDAELRRHLDLLIRQDDQEICPLEQPVFDDLAAIPAFSGSMLGRQLGPYRILSFLGAGGMGEVYRAHDLELGRDVAVKILSPDLAHDPERLARLRREARSLASLNHPNIATVYRLEQSDSQDCLVLELVEGETLKCPQPLRTALDYAAQIAEALEAAHEKGIIHRDLKPSNVKVTPKGIVKVLDFGLAKAIAGRETGSARSTSAACTETKSLSGSIVGTPGYMSPEQSRGLEVDQRTDIWAFGCLFYELLAGKRAFPGAAANGNSLAPETDVDWQALPFGTPAIIRKLLARCLEKDVDRRLSRVADARSMIEVAQSGKTSRPILAIAAAVLSAIIVATALWLRAPTGGPDHSEWIPLTKFPDPVSQPALSPDGKMLAFVRGPRTTYGLGQIYVKPLPDGEPVQLTNDTLKKDYPVFSPDGSTIAYSVVDPRFNWDTWVVPVRGGQPHLWLRNASRLTWLSPRRLLFSEIKPNYPMGIVSAAGDRTDERDVYMPWNARGMTSRSEASPDGRWVLIAEMSPYGNWDQCRVVPMDGSSRGRQVGPRAPCSFAAWSPDGRWMYLTSKVGGVFHLWRQRFPDGQPEQFTSGVTQEEGVAVASDGRSLVTAVGVESSTLWIHDSHGERQISVLEGNAADPRFSPDGRKLYYRIVKAVQTVGTKRDPGELWVTDLELNRSERLVPGLQPLEFDVSRDGRRLLLGVADEDGRPRLWIAPADRSGPPRQIPNVEGQNPLFGLDGKVFFRQLLGKSAFVYQVRPDGTELRKALEQTAFYANSISPDGRWMRIWGPLPGQTSAASQLVSLDGAPTVIIGSNTGIQWSSSGDCLWISSGPVPDGRTYIVPIPKSADLPRLPEGGFHSEEEIAALPGARRLDAEGAPGPSIEVYTFQRHTSQRNLYRIPIH
jgi:eukaryotic-like serine/threonine-protein kinase